MTVRIVAAALCRNGVVFSAPPPARHHTLLIAVDKTFGAQHEVFAPDEQGFLGSDGQFYDRARSKIIAQEARQLNDTVLGGSDLYSEDLW